MAVDSKVNLDDNALFRHKDYKELRDVTEEDPIEVEARRFDLNCETRWKRWLHGEWCRISNGHYGHD